MDFTLTSLLFLPIGLGLLGFIEPCSVGSTLVFVKVLEGRDASDKLVQVGVFALVRAVFTGVLGMLAVLAGSAFLGFQRAAWVVLGAFYALLGIFYVLGKAGTLMLALGPSLARVGNARGPAVLGLLFGLNIPACAAPLIFALLAAAAAGGASGATLAGGFVALTLFGLALSLPLIVAVLFEPARRAFDWTAALSRRLPFWTGLLLIALGLWSIGFGAFAAVNA
jgi:cytochrome c-type biogenesis protein